MTNARLSQSLRASARRANYLVQAAILSVAAATPIITNMGTAHAGQLTTRYIDISDGDGTGNGTGEGSGRDGGDAFGQDVTYQVSFDLATAHANIEGIVVDFCSNSPILADPGGCTAPAGFDVNEAGLAIANQVGISGFTLNAATDANTVILTDSTGTNLGASATVGFDLGSSGASDGITNPSSAGTFYARIATYTTDTDAAGYTSANPDAVGPRVDDGGIALAIANELTISARVQEQLQFCVGTTHGALPYDSTDDCTDISGTAINLGVVDSGAVSTTAADAGLVMIRTNAVNGATISYKSEQNNSSGQLKVAGAACTLNSVVDQCFNSAGTTKSAIVASTEEFGMTITESLDSNGGATQNLTCETQYEGDGAGCAGGAVTGYAWDESGAFDLIASSTTVLDDEMLTLEFAAAAAATTPTGLYSTTANFVATATF